MPKSPAARTVRRSASTPARWPAARGSPRALAQRPLPSMMIAIWAGFTMRPLSGEPLARERLASERLAGAPRPKAALPRSNLQYLGFLLGQQDVDGGDGLVRHLLDALVLDARIVLADVAVLLRLLGVVDAVAADVAHRHLGLLGVLMRDLDQLLAPLLVELRQRDAQIGAVDDGVEAEIGFADRPVDRADELLVPDRNREHARFRHADGGHLGDRHRRAIGLDHDRVEQVGGGATRAQRGEVMLEGGYRAVHAPLQILEIDSGAAHQILRCRR